MRIYCNLRAFIKQKQLDMRRLICPLSLFCLLLLASCNALHMDDDTFHHFPLTTKQLGYVEEGHSFDFNLVRDVAECSQGKNWVVSPLGMQFLLGMLANGTKGETARQISNAMGYGDGEIGEINEYLSVLMNDIPKTSSPDKLAFANAFFADRQIPIESAWKRTVRKYYAASVENMDLATPGAANKINQWCKDKTGGRINGFLEENQPCLAALLSAMYFQGDWDHPFSKSESSQQFFRLETGGGCLCQYDETERKVSLVLRKRLLPTCPLAL